MCGSRSVLQSLWIEAALGSFPRVTSCESGQPCLTFASSRWCLVAAGSCTKPGAAPVSALWRRPGARTPHAEGQRMGDFRQ